jgi:inner membrane protein
MVTQDFQSNRENVIYPEPAKGAGNIPQQPTNSHETNFVSRNHLAIKAILISIMTLFLMIPMAFISSLISERERTARDATEEVHRKWSSAQTIVGPILTIPFYEIPTEKDGKKEKTLNVLQILPETLFIRGEAKTQELKRGLYEIVVYNAPIELKGNFILPEAFYNLSEEALREIFVEEAMLNIGISDLRGISEQVNMKWGDQQLIFNSGIQQTTIVSSGVSAHVNLKTLLDERTVEFSVRLELKGSETLRFAPLGKTTVVNLQSNCATPSFTGAFLPDNRDVNNDGFKGEWKVMDLNRNYPQMLTGYRWEKEIDNSVFGVDMLLPVQHYQKSTRTVKYAIIIIILTFVVSFFIEVLQKKRIHPFQYLLIGLALCLFYSLLISISEHTGFTVAYGIASIMTVALLTCYMTGVLKIKKTAFTIGGLLAVLYLCIFILIQLETYALLVGSVGLFVILAVIMYFSQRINWSGQ